MLAKVLADELKPQYDVLMPQISSSERYKQAKQAGRAFASHLIGKYGTKTKTLYLLPGSLHPLLKSCKVDPKHYLDIVKLIVAHELTHALQDQEVGLAKLLCSADTAEKSFAINATIEGHATFIQDRIADKLKLQTAQKEYSRSISAMDIEIDPAIKMLSNPAAKRSEDTYLTGRDFIAWHFKHGGNPKVWQIIANPPLKTAMLYNPQTYSTIARSTIDYKKVLAGLEKKIPGYNWQVQNSEIGELGLRSVYTNMDSKSKEFIVSKLSHAQALVAVDSDSMFNASVFILKDRKLTPKVVNDIERMARGNINKLKESPVVQVKSSTFTDFPGITAEIARKLSYSFTIYGRDIEDVIVRVGRGRVMAEIYFENINVTDKQIADIAEEIFKRLPKYLTSE